MHDFAYIFTQIIFDLGNNKNIFWPLLFMCSIYAYGVHGNMLYLYLNVKIICKYNFFLLILDLKHFTGIKFCILFWLQSKLMIFIVVHPTKNIYAK